MFHKKALLSSKIFVLEIILLGISLIFILNLIEN